MNEMELRKSDLQTLKKLMWSSWHDFVRCKREYGDKHEVTLVARNAYDNDYRNWKEALSNLK